MYCDKDDCDGPVKPDIGFTGEHMPSQFHQICTDTHKNCDLLIVIGTILKVPDFSNLVWQVTLKHP